MVFRRSLFSSIVALFHLLLSISQGLSLTSVNTYPYVKAFPNTHSNAYPHQTQKFAFRSISPVSPLTILNGDLRCMTPKGWCPLSGDYTPWSQRPICVDGKSDGNTKIMTFCLFANKYSNKGRGIMAVTTPQIAKRILLSAPFEGQSETDVSNKPVAWSTGRPKYGIWAFTQRDRIEHVHHWYSIMQQHLT
jgi:hypothetical protein